MLLSLDISTSCTGWSVFDGTELIEYGHVRLSGLKKWKGADLFDKLDEICYNLVKLKEKYPAIDDVIVEQYLLSFSRRSNQNTIVTLACFNSMIRASIRYIWPDIRKPVSVSFAKARRSLFGKTPKGEDAKKMAFDYVVAHFQNFVPTFTKTGKVSPYSMDETDSICLGYYYQSNAKQRTKIASAGTVVGEPSTTLGRVPIQVPESGLPKHTKRKSKA